MTLLEADVSAAAFEAADKRFASGDVDRVMIEDTTDSDGGEALRITIVVKSGAFGRIPDDAVLDTLVDIRENLAALGESRLPIVYYVTPEELADNADS